MILIAESGGTKTQWCGVSKMYETDIITTIGLNPNFVSQETIKDTIRKEVLPLLKSGEFSEIWFYGAGCAGESMEKKVQSAIMEVIPRTNVTVSSDLTGAAKSLLGNRSGYVCMLGTGSNSGFYNGKVIEYNVPPLGFILGDEGSGAYLGKIILADFLRGIMPATLAEEFRSRYGPEKDDVVSHVYRGIFPSRFIGGFVLFLKENIEEQYCRDLVRRSFEDFVRRNLNIYGIKGKTEIVAAGSVAWSFREILEEVLAENDFILTEITREPILGLIKYHRMFADP
jgi:glucosamine kinase